MPSKKPRITTYTTEEALEKFRIISEYNKRTMSNHMSYIIDNTIKTFEKEHGEIILKKG